MRANSSQRRVIPSLVLGFVAFLTFFPGLVSGLEEYRAKEQKDRLLITTPYGEKSFSGGFRLDAMRHYKVLIPLDDLRPPGVEKKTESESDSDSEEGDGDSSASKVEETSKSEQTATMQVLPTPSPSPAPEAKKEEDRKPAAIDGLAYDDSDRLVVEANRYYNQGRFYESMIYVEELIRKRPKYLRAWVMKGSLLYMQGHKDLAKEAWDEALKLDPENTYVKGLMTRYR